MTDAFKCDIIEKNERKTDMAGDFGFDPTSAEKDYYFISYRNVDQERVAPIVRKLYELGLPIWYDGGIKSGELWGKIIPQKIRNCKEVILFITSHTMRYDEKDTPHVKLEYELAKEDYEKTVHIIQMEEIQNCDVPDHLKLWWKDVRQIQGVNIAHVEDFNDQISLVCKAIGVSVDSLLRIKSSSTNSNYASKGLEFKRLSDGNYAVTGIGTCSDRILVIPPVLPDGGKVVEIAGWAFEKCNELVSVTIPNSIRCIGPSAFWGCTRLSEIVIPNGVECISDCAFSMCIGLKMIRIPSSVMRMGKDVIRGLRLSAFFDYACTNNAEILCEHPSQPSTWDENWNPDNCPVVWNFNPKNQ